MLPVILEGKLSSDVGYFNFGPKIRCYGRSSTGSRTAQLKSAVEDVSGAIVVTDRKVALPFNPTEVIDNLRLERYAKDVRMGEFVQKLVTRTYYLLRPMLGVEIRKHMQRAWLHLWNKLPFPVWPVDRTVEDICGKILTLSLEAQGLQRIPFIWFWPNSATGCVMMTHDIETSAGLNACSWLMDLDDAFGMKASFQVVPEGRYQVSPQLLSTICRRGFEVAIQDLNHDGLLFLDREEFLRRCKKINQYAREYGARGFRAAVLYRRQEWYDALEFSFDMSIPNVAHFSAQPGGCCTVMPYFIGNILELPVTTTEDYTLFNVLGDYSIDLWKTQTELILQNNGLVSFIIHPDYILKDNARAVYESLLHYLQGLRAEMNLWFVLPSEIERWWRARARMHIIPEGSSWRIEGDGAEKAVLAYAKIGEGKLVYEISASSIGSN